MFEHTIKIFQMFDKMIKHHGYMGQMIPCCSAHEDLSAATGEIAEAIRAAAEAPQKSLNSPLCGSPEGSPKGKGKINE